MRGSAEKVTFFRGKAQFYQDHRHKISVDLVLFLSRVHGLRKASRVVDLGAGFGFLSISLALKFGCSVVAVERDRYMVELLKKNVELNGVGNLVEIVEGDVKEARESFDRGVFDVCVCNPPFFKEGSAPGVHTELDTTMMDFVMAGSYLLRDGGYFNLMIPSFRLVEVIGYLEAQNLPLRFMTAVFPTIGKPCRECFLTSIRNVPGPLHFEKPLIINGEEGRYTQEVSTLLEEFLS